MHLHSAGIPETNDREKWENMIRSKKPSNWLMKEESSDNQLLSLKCLGKRMTTMSTSTIAESVAPAGITACMGAESQRSKRMEIGRDTPKEQCAAI